MSSQLRTPDDFISDDESGDDGNPEIDLKEGDFMIGEVQEIKEEVGQYGSDVLVLTLENTSVDDHEGGDTVEYFCRSNLERKLRKERVRGGDTVCVRRDEDWTGTPPGFDDEVTSFQYTLGVE